MQSVSPDVPHAFNYDKASLTSIWGRMHSIDQEPLPTAEALAARLSRPGVDLQQASPAYGDDYAGLSDAILSAWVDFHNGAFRDAFETGKRCGPIACYVTYLAQNSYASYVAQPEEQAELFLEAAEGAKAAAACIPGDINSEYVYALNIGRYLESVSIARAISSGVAPAFKKSLEHCLALKPGHVPSLLAQGALFTQVIDAIGELAARVSFGATRKKVIAAYEQALQSPTPPPVVYLEYARNLRSLDPKNKARAQALLQQALELPVLDPLDVYDQRDARALLAELQG
ncbi:MAG: hypothetical protein R3208_03215 [Ketobacteraceae bacterium]|nr:hypothetical protein [Ketobacteraceae bacterium]